MASDFQAYTSEGILRGEFGEGARLSDALEHEPELRLHDVRLDGLAGGSEGAADAAVSTEDLLVVVAPPGTSTPVHAAWNPVSLVVPPYVVEAELPTLPGFDPGRALARPGGPFVLVGHVRIGSPGRDAGQRDEHEFAWVNRYAVEAIESELELPFYFPGAVQHRSTAPTPPPPAPPTAA